MLAQCLELSGKVSHKLLDRDRQKDPILTSAVPHLIDERAEFLWIQADIKQ